MSERAAPSVFTRIIERELPADIVFEDERFIAFTDIAPKAPVHLLVVPKTAEYANVVELAANDPQLLADLVTTAQRVATEHTGGDFRLVFNNGPEAGQTVFHTHAHVLGSPAAAPGLEEESLKEGSLA
ncbi:MAG: histidine triad nucleotide-binding protein [Microbacterium sp.]|nr:histidine triad nucleotide-binding protein [Microbacterium sp.]